MLRAEVVVEVLEGELPPAGGTTEVWLVFYPLVEAVLVELVLAVELSYHRLLDQVLQAKTAVIILVQIFGLVLDVPQELPLHQLLYFYFELEPSEGVGGHDMVVPPSIVDHQCNNSRFDDDEENDDKEGY